MDLSTDEDEHRCVVRSLTELSPLLRMN